MKEVRYPAQVLLAGQWQASYYEPHFMHFIYIISLNVHDLVISYYSHSVYEEIEAQRGQVICSRSHSK